MLRKYSFLTLARKQTEISHIDKIEFLELKFAIEVAKLLPEQQEKLKAGFVTFLEDDCIKKPILALLDKKDEDDEDLEFLTVSAARKQFKIGPHDRFEETHIEFKSKRRSGCCERALPPFMKATLVSEFLLFIPLLSAAMGTSEMELFDANEDIAKKLVIAQSVLFIFFILLNMFTGAGANNLSEVGAIFDNVFYSCWRIINCKKKSTPEAKREIDECNNRLKRWVAKGGMTIFALVYLFSDFLMDYQQFQSMEATVTQMAPYTIFPADWIRFAMTLNFYLSQSNSPIYSASLLNYAFKKADKRYSPKLLLDAPSNEEKIDIIIPNNIDEKKQEEETISSSFPSDSSILTSHLLPKNDNLPSDYKNENEKPRGCWARLLCCINNKPKAPLIDPIKDKRSINHAPK